METYYRERAAECARDAAAASLAKVRERSLRAQEVWLGLAERASQTASYRRERETTSIKAADVAHKIKAR